MIKNNKGFTLIELLVTIVVFGIVIALGYQLLFYTQDNFERTEEQWSRQGEVNASITYMGEILDKSIYLSIIDNNGITYDSVNETISFSGSDQFAQYDGAVFVAQDENGDNVTCLYNGVLGITKFADDIDISFSKIEIDDTGEYYDNLLLMEATAADINYSISSRLIIENLQEDRRIEDNLVGDLIIFRTEETIAEVPVTVLTGCFIATAANGNDTQSSVVLLRIFRDNILLKTKVGTKFVDLYYTYAPAVSDVIADSNILKLLTRTALLPLVGVVVVLFDPIILLSMILGIYLASRKFRYRNINRLKA